MITRKNLHLVIQAIESAEKGESIKNDINLITYSLTKMHGLILFFYQEIHHEMDYIKDEDVVYINHRPISLVGENKEKLNNLLKKKK